MYNVNYTSVDSALLNRHLLCQLWLLTHFRGFVFFWVTCKWARCIKVYYKCARNLSWASPLGPSIPVHPFVMQATSAPRWPIRSASLAAKSTPSPPYHQLWLTASHRKGDEGRGGLIYLLCSHGTKLMIPANRIIQRGKKPEKSAPGWTIWSSLGFL